nr:DUF4391 domain-containing protein [uncultured Bacteroides sp.]
MEIFEYIGYKEHVKPYDKRIPKTQLFLQGGLSKAERELLTEKVEEVRLMYVFNQHTYPMEVVVSNEEQYNSIFVVLAILKSEVSVQRLSRIIQETLPSPTIILFKLGNKYLFSSALKRLNKNEKQKVVTEEYHYSSWIDLENPTNSQKDFLLAVSFGRIPALDYKQAYVYLHRQIYEESNAEIVSKINASNFEELKQKAEEQKAIQQEIDRLAKMLNQKSVSLKEKVELARQINLLDKK